VAARLAAGVAAVLFLGGVAPAATAPARSGEIVLGFAPGTAAEQQAQVLERFALEVVRRVPHLDQVLVRTAGRPVDSAALLRQPAVTSVAGVARFRTAAAAGAPKDPAFARQWNLPMIQVPEAWEVSRGQGAVVAVLDTGVAYETFGPYKKAPDLAGTTFIAGHDFVDDDDHPNDDIDPSAPNRPAHGTHSATIIAATTGNGVGIAGVAPGAAIMPVRVLDATGGGDDDQIAAGIVWAVDHGANVLNMSFDSTFDGPMTRAAVAYAASKEVTMVAATGNTGRGVVGYPAAYPEVLAVGAVRIDRTRPQYSTFGALGDVDLVAPGGDVTVDQNGDGAPDGILGHSMANAINGFGEQAVEGTSAAAPHVSAVAALLVGSGLARTATQVRTALVASALDLGPTGPDPFHGAGLVQARAALTAAGAPPATPGTPPSTAPSSGLSVQSEPARVPWAPIFVVSLFTLAACAAVALTARRRS